MNNQKSLYELRSLAKEDKLPIQVVVKIFGQYKAYAFKTLSEARRLFPELDPDINGELFTWGTRGEVNTQTDNGAVKQEALRFEDWATENAYSL